MRAKAAVLENEHTQRTKYVWAAIAILIVALLLGATVAAPRVFAGDIKNLVGDKPVRPAWTYHVPPVGLVTASASPIQRGIDADSARYQAMGGYYLQRGIEAATARWVALGTSLTGSERGIAADSQRYQAMGVASIQHGIEADTARLVASGKFYTGIGRGIAADSQRYQAMGLANVQRGLTADSVRLTAIALDYLAKAGDDTTSDLLATKFGQAHAQVYGRSGGAETDVLAENPELLLARSFSSTPAYTDVSKFYAERMRVLAHQNSSKTLAENPELLLARSFSSTPAYTDVSKFYAERMRVLAHQNSLAACVLREDSATLADNPELVYATSYANLLYAGQALVC